MDQLIEKTYAQVSGALNSIYKKRKRTLFFQKATWMITGIFFVFLLLNMAVNYFPNSESNFLEFFQPFRSTQDNPYGMLFPFIALVVLTYPATYYFTTSFSKFKIEEMETTNKMVKMLFPKVAFAKHTGIPTKEVTKSKLFAWVEKGAPIFSYGQISSSTNDNTINIADIGIVEQDVSNQIMTALMNIPILNMFVVLYQYVLKNIFTNKSADNVYHTFRGMFCWLKFKKSLQGHTVVLTNNQSTKLDRYFSSNFKEEQKIELEDPRFTDQFIVYSTDQVEARYVLSTALMERIVALKEKFNQPILLSFHDNEMYLAVKNDNGIFSFPSGKLDNIKIIEELASDINTALQVAKELRLE